MNNEKILMLSIKKKIKEINSNLDEDDINHMTKLIRDYIIAINDSNEERAVNIIESNIELLERL